LRSWSENDVVEVFLPFTKHLFYGPDKMEVASTGKNETRTSFEPTWLGSIMYGPLVMATPDITHWNQAEYQLHANLNEITLEGASNADGYNGNLYTLTLNGHVNFQPDYYQTESSTHYLRLNVESGTPKRENGTIDRSSLELYLQIARERVESQNAWNTMTVKVPAYAPWAPHGYARMLEQIQAAERISAIPEATQAEISKAANSLSMIVNTMRPGNLAEPEDLQELLSLTSHFKNVSNKSEALRSAINYAETIIQYVNDGSGTPDMIEKAISRLHQAQ